VAKYNQKYQHFIKKEEKFFMALMDRPEFLEIIKERLKEKNHEKEKKITRKDC